MGQDYYLEARNILQQLQDQGFQGWANQIEEAISGGSTATEILMGVRWILREFKKSGVKIQPNTKKKIDSLLVELDKVLL